MLAGGRCFPGWELEESFYPRAAALAASQWCKADAEHRAARKTVGGNAFTRTLCGAAHFDEPRLSLTLSVAHERFALFVERHEDDLHVGAVRDDALDHASEDVGDRSVVHRERMMRRKRNSDEQDEHERFHRS